MTLTDLEKFIRDYAAKPKIEVSPVIQPVTQTLRLCENRSSQPRGVSRQKATNDAFFEKGEGNSGDRLMGSRTSREQVESKGKRQPDRATLHGLGGSDREVESQRDKLQRLSET
jgi:hypothetical protein